MRHRTAGDLTEYDAPKHFRMRALRMHGFDEDGSKLKVGLSHFLPGGGAERGSSPVERLYIVLSGEITVTAGGTEVTLRAMDSCHIPAGEEREVINRSDAVASMLVVMPK